MDSLKEVLKDKRPNLSDKSINTYASVLKTIMKNMKFDTVKQLDNDKKVLEYLAEMKPNTRKTRLSALFVLTENEAYKKNMLEDVNAYNNSMKSQTKNDKETENWITKDELFKIYNNLKKDTNVLFRKKNKNMSDLQDIQAFVMLSLFVLLPPRRALDYSEMKIKNIDKTKDNYIKGNNLIFNIYKTSKQKGQQIIEVPKQLKSILNKWVKINTTDYLLFDNKGGKLTSVKINQRFKKLLGKNFSVNMFRKLFLSDKYADTMEQMKNLEKDMVSMGSSKSQVNHYVKVDE
jgi:integrase